MREWYRTKLRELAAAPNQELAQAATIAFPKPSELDPGDRQLGELLKSLDLVDAETLASLWNEATRQHRTLRQVLLANGAITLYQLALIEAGNLDALMLDRFRVVDRIRMTPREAVYRVHDPRVGSPDGDSLSVLRILGEAEMMDAMHPDEYRQRFQTASTLNHPNLVQIREVLDIHSRPAVLQEYVSGVPGSLWPADCLTPAAWIKIMLEVTGAVQAGHSAGIAHGHLSLDSILLVASGVIKVTGTGEPLWLVSGQDQEATPQDDLAALAEIGTIAFALISKKKGKAARGTDSITAVLQRLGSKEWQTSASENGARYRNAEEVIHDLQTLAGQFPCTEETWNEFLRIVLEYEGERKPRRSA
jgi:serine/threonine protein kinase